MKKAAYLAAQVIKSNWPEVDERRVYDIISKAMEFNPVLAFLTDRCIAVDNTVTGPELWKAYLQWCIDYDIRPLDKRTFFNGIRQAGFKSKRWGTGLIFRGLAIVGSRDKI